MNDDFRLAEVYILKILDEIRQLASEHTEPEFIIPDNEDNSAFIEVRCFVSDEMNPGDASELRYKIVCPEGYWGKNRQEFINHIKEKYVK